MNIIQDVKANSTEIKFICNEFNIILNARGMCCSYSWFEFDNINECIGKSYVKCIDTYRTVELEHSNIERHDVNHVYEIYFDDDTTYEIILRNSSNGYYDGYIEEEITLCEHKEIDTKRNAIILLVGLPGCGKTTFGKLIKESFKDCIFYDDCDIMLQSTVNSIRLDLIHGKKVIVAHSKFCMSYMYNYFVDNLNLIDNHKSIVTYCFIPDKDKSINNIYKREKSNVIIKKLITSINQYYELYTMNHIENTYQCKKIKTY